MRRSRSVKFLFIAVVFLTCTSELYAGHAPQSPQTTQPAQVNSGARTSFLYASADLVAAMPAAPGKAVTVRTCSMCHTLENITTTRKTRDQWTDTVSTMAYRGATATDDEFQQILNYVSKYYSPPGAPLVTTQPTRRVIHMSEVVASMPEAPGKAVVVRTCTMCHSIRNITNSRHTREDWSELVDTMASRGAMASDAEFDQIVDYVSTYYKPSEPLPGEVHTKFLVNKETAAQLHSHLGLSEFDALAVVGYRTKHGEFKSVKDLMKVPDVDGKKFEAHAADLEF